MAMIASAQVVAPLNHEQRAGEDGAVHRDERQEDTQRRIERGDVFVEEHLKDLHRCRDNADVGNETKEADIHFQAE